MPKNTLKMKKRYQKFCKSQAKSGLINDADGKWIKIPSMGSMARDYKGGHRL